MACGCQGPYRLVVRTLRCGRDNPGSTPGEDTLWVTRDRGAPGQFIRRRALISSQHKPENLGSYFCQPSCQPDLRKLGFQPERLIFHVASTQAWILLPSFPTRSAGASVANLQTHCPGKALARTFNCLRARGLLIGKPAIAQLVKHLTVVSCGGALLA